jgi:hypothetical protein
MAAEIVMATETHMLELISGMRPDDAAECFVSGSTPEATVRESVGESTVCHAMLVDGAVAAVGGLGEVRGSMIGGHSAQAWLLTSGVVESKKLSFHRAIRLWLEVVSEMVDLVWALVDARYERCLDWLRALGFSTGRTIPIGPNRAPFVYVWKEF